MFPHTVQKCIVWLVIALLLYELIQYCLVHDFEGQINLTFEDGKIMVSEPSKELAPDYISFKL